VERVPTYGKLREMPQFPGFQRAGGIGELECLTESKTFNITVLNQVESDVFTMPQGYATLVGIIYDPSVGAFIDIRSQRARQDILLGFNTLGAGLGFLSLENRQLEQDVLNYRLEFFSLGKISAAYWNGAAGVNVTENQLPFKHTVTMIYGR